VVPVDAQTSTHWDDPDTRAPEGPLKAIDNEGARAFIRTAKMAIH